ncbi:MAG: thiamine phosphate synthase [Desulfobacteraceae bacterium]
MMKKKIGKLHVLTDTVVQCRFSHVQLTEMAVRGGADIIQFRQKTGSTREMIDLSRKMRTLCAHGGVSFIVNDRVDIALACNVHGVHLGQDDFPIPLARELLGPEGIIGGSASTLEEARKCVSDGADYVGLGPVYPTGSKEDAGPVVGIETLKQVAAKIPVPVIAIGGIDETKIPEIMGAGAHGIAVISAVCRQQDPEAAVRALCKALMK